MRRRKRKMHWYHEFLILGWMLDETLLWILVME